MAQATILVVDATGNTGKSVVRNLPKLLESSSKSFRIVGLTRSQGVVRAYVAPHNLPHQFVEESALYIAMLHAGVEYVVKVSTCIAFIGPTNPVYYGRTHWAIEELLSQPEFNGMQWTSLRPNFFTASLLPNAVQWIKSYQATGKQELLAIVSAADAAAAVIDPDVIGDVGAHLLALEDPAPHNHAKYVLSGREDVTGKMIVELVEQLAGVKVQEVEFESITWLNDLVKHGHYTEKELPSIMAGLRHIWQGTCSLAGTPTSKEILEIAPPRRSVADAIKAMLNE